MELASIFPKDKEATRSKIVGVLANIEDREAVRKKIGDPKALSLDLSATGKSPATHAACISPVSEKRLAKWKALQKLTTIEENTSILQILHKWGLRLVKQ
jgi:hypothetical protein